jgi:hypothetical protein
MEVSGQFHALAGFNTGETAPGTHWIGCWVDPVAVLDNVEKINFFDPTGIGTPIRRSSSP